jgi:5-methylcytosine-specific restriction enzyme subunit McrC
VTVAERTDSTARRRSDCSRCKYIMRTSIANQGILIRSHDGNVILPTIMISMESVFESYLRSVLRSLCDDQTLSVLDGNRSPPTGAQLALFEDGDMSANSNRAEPDIVIRNNGSTELVIDAKYKPRRHELERSDIDQVLVYGLVYKCKRVALAYPRRNTTNDSIQRVGVVGGIELFKIAVNLGADDLQEEERRLIAATRSLLLS